MTRADEPRPTARGPASTVWRLAVAGVIVAGIAVGGAIRMEGRAPTDATSASPAGSGSQGASTSGRGDPFPSTVAGLPVVSVAHAVDLLWAGNVDGQAIAVAGYYDAFYPSCPFPGRYIGPLEDWCDFSVLADSAADATLCQTVGANTTSCTLPKAAHLRPFFMPESGNPSSILPKGPFEPERVVLIGHVGDPRQWQCTVETKQACANAFVVDRVAWADGRPVALVAPEMGDPVTGAAVTPRMTLDQVASVLGSEAVVVSGAASRSGSIATIDPRWNIAGDVVVWIVRTIAAQTSAAGSEVSHETVTLVDDATGAILESQPLELDAAYQPSRLWQMATVHGLECCTGSLLAFERVSRADGSIAYDGFLSGGSTGTDDTTTFGGGYGGLPLVLPAGRYTVTVWLATYQPGTVGTPQDACSTDVAVPALQDVVLNATFPGRGACRLAPAAMPSPGS